MKHNILLIDDEPRAIENLENLLSQFCSDFINTLYTATNSYEALKICVSNQPDIVFADIQMPGKSGIELATELNKLQPAPLLVFVTAYNQYGIEAVKSSAVDYICKPIDPIELRNACIKLDSILSQHNTHPIPSLKSDKIGIPTSSGIQFVKTEDIAYFEADGCYSCMHLRNGKKLTISKTLKEFEKKLNPPSFLRIHQSFLVHINAVENYSILDGGSLRIENGNILPIARRKLNLVKSAIQEHCIRIGD